MWSSAEQWRAPLQDFPPIWADAWGDDQYGLWADMVIGSATQRLRWIEPTGAAGFVMGSSEKEREAIKDGDFRRWANEREAPAHRVILTSGFWLADTPCTQALWEALMGANPSHFTGHENSSTRPVEQVSWDMVCGAELGRETSFMMKLQALLNIETTASLPSEAEWEYACRAGTTTAYWWGNEADEKRANMGSNYQQTTPVTQFPANPWGLYDMHGNVWEWCRDLELRAYTATAEPDPEGLQEGSSRVLRGGAWSSAAARARAAYRLHGPRGHDWYGGGFRFALRSRAPGGPSVGGAD